MIIASLFHKVKHFFPDIAIYFKKRRRNFFDGVFAR